MNICIIVPGFVNEPTHADGAEQHFYRVAKWAVAQGHRVDVITCSKIEEDVYYEGIYVHQVTLHMPFLLRVVNKLTCESLKTILMRLAVSCSIYRKAKQLHQRNRFDVVQSVPFKLCGLMTLLFLRVSHVISANTYRPESNRVLGIQTTLQTKTEEFLERFCYRLTSNIFTHSRAVQKTFAEKANVKNVRVIRSPFYQEVQRLDDSVYRETLEGKTYLLFFGRLEKRKGAHILGQALPQIFSKIPEAYAVFVGSDGLSPLGSSMRQYIGELCGNYHQRLTFMKPCCHEQLYPIIKRAHLVVLPSLLDNLPNAMLEAMGHGKVVLGTKGVSFDEVIEDGKNGFLVNPDNPQELAHKIIEVWNRKDLDEIGRNALREMEKFSPEKVVADLLDYYQEIIDRDRNKIKKRKSAYNN